MSLARIDVENVSHLWSSKGRPPVAALQNISCSFRAGKVSSNVGPSGCGKSTLLLILRQLLTPTSGRVIFQYEDGDGVRAGQPARMATVWQSFNLYPWRTVLENVTFGLELAGQAKDEYLAKSAQAIRAVDLAGFENHYPGQLSGGMRQRVGLARALVRDPDVLLLDEPFGALDAQTRLYMQEQLASLVERSGMTVILITHSIEEAVFLSDEVFVMTARPGRIAMHLPVTLPRPRMVDMQNMPESRALFSQIYELLREEVAKSMMLAGAGA